MQASALTENAMTQAIMQLLQCYWRLPAKIHNTHDHTVNCFHQHALKIGSMFMQRKPLLFLLPAFPAKSPNPEKTAGVFPDLGERLALRQLNEICQRIDSIYPFGVEMKICSDGRVFSDLVRVAEPDVDAYAAGIERIIVDEKLNWLTTYSLDDCYSGKSHHAMRDELTKQYGDTLLLLRSRVKTKESYRRLFNGIHRFIYEDQVHQFESASKNQIRRMTKEVAYHVIQRSNAWSHMLEKTFPDAIRLSIHPQTCDSNKMGVMLLKSSDEWATPWHRVVLKIGEVHRLVRRKEAEVLGAEAIHVDGVFSHYEFA